MEINKVNKAKKLPKKINVCAYARVSTEKDAMLDSLANQVSYYSSHIQSRRDWLYVGVFSDEAISGTKANRPGFQKMLEEARNRKIDLIITKSISRFARNTVTLLETIRELKELNVDVYFEEQRIHSISKEGELMLTILVSYAQEEARSASENVKWRVKKNFEEGIPYKLAALGYRLINGKIVVIPEEAKIVKLIYKLYLDGLGTPLIAKELNKLGYKTMMGNEFAPQPIRAILRNITYTGDLLLQKKYKNKGTHDIHIVDFHTNATSEKNAYLATYAGQISAILGTHTHVQTADEKIYKNTAYITDTGMSGPSNGIIGAAPKTIIQMYREQVLHFKLDPDTSKYQFNAVLINFNNKTNLPTSIKRINLIEK